ncbi:CU044_2847 family protein [Sphaerisporangium aureirubrum]|uniref:CU044_2847 family protein n=1 Tax=Sphaerisporangium aureirubrum TaxID=1544736 RepID=A0ABW1NPQ0_9ACTN
MSELMSIALSGGGEVLVEVSPNDPGIRRAGRAGDVIEASTESLQAALQPIRAAAEAALDAFRKSAPNEVEIEFGVRLTAEAGAVIAKSGVEGHLTVKLTWRGES